MLQELVASLGRGETFVLILTVLGAMVGLAFFIPVVWQKVRLAEISAGLKHQMLERGMSAEEIKTVLEAGQSVALAALGQKVSQQKVA
jgi:hypothetical protein